MTVTVGKSTVVSTSSNAVVNSATNGTMQGTFYYSNKVKFTNGTNTPTYSADSSYVISNYSGTCIQ